MKNSSRRLSPAERKQIISVRRSTKFGVESTQATKILGAIKQHRIDYGNAPVR
jgi:hypothetical protein